MTMNAQFATAFGIGRIPHAPGTAASFVAIIMAVPVMYLTGWVGMALLAIATAGAGVWFSDAYASEIGVNDPGDCVIDEFAGQWLACAFAPLTPAGFLLAFLLFRLFDVAKPWPVSKAETLRGGLGIVADDVVAGLLAGVFVFLVSASGFL
jgi:phosphatidylglycerophosphatase A